jgi:hypothetical protein
VADEQSAEPTTPYLLANWLGPGETELEPPKMFDRPRGRCQDTCVLLNFLVGDFQMEREAGVSVVRGVFCFAVVFLLLSVACTELPELLSLHDNTSNDFVVNASGSNHRCRQPPITNAASTVREPNSDVCYCQDCQARTARRPRGIPRTGRDLLILLSLQRK